MAAGEAAARRPLPTPDMEAVTFAEDGGPPEPELFVLSVGQRCVEAPALGVMRRAGGLMLAVPTGTYPPSRLGPAQRAGRGALVGPSVEVEVPLQAAEGEDADDVPRGNGDDDGPEVSWACLVNEMCPGRLA